MNSAHRILFAVIANLAVAGLGLFGGLLSGSHALISESIHALGDGMAMFVSFLFERQSKKSSKKSGKRYKKTRDYSQLGANFVYAFMLVAAGAMIFEALGHDEHHHEVDSLQMFIFAALAMLLNLVAAVITHRSHSKNSRAVSLHSVQDVLIWGSVMLASLLERYSDIEHLDTIFTILIASFIIYRCLAHFFAPSKHKKHQH